MAGKRSLTPKAESEIIAMRRAGWSYAAIGREKSLPKGSIWRICNRKKANEQARANLQWHKERAERLAQRLPRWSDL